jgi:hypothetical protein
MDPFLRSSQSLPAESALAVAPSDTASLAPPSGDPNKATRGLLIGGSGNVQVDMADGTTVTLTFPATACGLMLPIAVKKVHATGTTATAIVAFY